MIECIVHTDKKNEKIKFVGTTEYLNSATTNFHYRILIWWHLAQTNLYNYTLSGLFNSLLYLQCLRCLDLQLQCMVGNEMLPNDGLSASPTPFEGTGHFSRNDS